MADETDPQLSGGRNWEPIPEGDPLSATDPLVLTPGGNPVLMVGTKKGAFFFTSDSSRHGWHLNGPAFLGHIVHHIVADPRDRRTILVAIRTGHLGPTVFRSTDLGESWKEASRPPAFAKAKAGEIERSVDQVFYLRPGHSEEAGVWYAGTSPEGLFRSEDNGDTWTSVAGWNDHEMWSTWCPMEQSATPDGSPMHSILIDPRDKNHMYASTSSAGVFESTDQGESWTPLNRGSVADFLPEPNPEWGQDPHCVEIHPLDPDVLYQQNHCGIYRLFRPEGQWQRVGDNMPREIGDIGFAIALHPRDSNVAWVFPMDGTDVWPRTSPRGNPAVYQTRDGGQSWVRQAEGLPEKNAWFTVYRQAMAVDDGDPLGLYFGTTNGELWGSSNEGESFSCIAAHLPHVYSVEAGSLV